MSHVTWTPLSGSKGQGHQAALLTAVLVRQAAAVVGVTTCWPWETAAMLPSAAQGTSAPTKGGGGIPWRPPAYSLFHTPMSWYITVCPLHPLPFTVTNRQ